MTVVISAGISAGVVLFNQRRLPNSTSVFIGAILASSVACVAAIVGLFAVAVRFWPTSWLLKGDSNHHFTALDLH